MDLFWMLVVISTIISLALSLIIAAINSSSIKVGRLKIISL